MRFTLEFRHRCDSHSGNGHMFYLQKNILLPVMMKVAFNFCNCAVCIAGLGIRYLRKNIILPVMIKAAFFLQLCDLYSGNRNMLTLEKTFNYKCGVLVVNFITVEGPTNNTIKNHIHSSITNHNSTTAIAPTANQGQQQQQQPK